MRCTGSWRRLGQDQQLFCQLSRHLQLRPRFMKDPQSPQDREHVRRLPHLPTQLPRPGVGLCHFRSPKPLGSNQRGAKCGLQLQFLLKTRRRVRKHLEHL